MTTSNFHRLIVISAIVFVISTFLPIQIQAQETESYNLDETFTISQNGTLYLESNDANVEITGSNRNDVHLVVEYQSEFEGYELNERSSFEMIVEERGGDLEIREKDRKYKGINVSITRRKLAYSISIEVPRNVNIELVGDDDNYVIDHIDGYLRMNLDDATVSLKDYQGDELRLEMDDGDMEIDKISGSLRAEFDDASLNIMQGDLSQIDISGDDADIVINTMLHDDGNYRFRFDDGDLDLGILGGGGIFKIDHDNVRLRARGNFEEIDADDNYSEYRLQGGDAVVRIRTDDGEITLGTK